MTVKYPQIQLKLTGGDGNAFAVLGQVQHALRKAGVPKAEIDAFIEEATSGDYDHLLATCLKTVDVE